MDTVARIKFLSEALDLKRHPEGGYYKEVYRSSGKIPSEALPDQFGGNRSFGTSIYFLLTSESFSSFHKIYQDETWHFYEGSTIELHTISPNGTHKKVKIGARPEKSEIFQFTVSGGHWFAARVIEEDSYALVGCTVMPGFDFDDFILGKRSELTALFPQHSSLIAEFTYQ